MSDCRNGGRGTYAVPKPVEQATIKRMCREFGKPPWTYPVDKPECWPDEAVELVGAIEFGGERYERVRECAPTIELWESDAAKFDAYCGNCGCEIGDELMRLPNYCPRCGARVRGGGDD